MFSLKSFLKPWSADTTVKPPERDQQMVVTESLIVELEYHCRELERVYRDRENEERRKSTGVDYSWLISAPAKTFELPQLERLELEELCYQVKGDECGKVIALFRDTLLNEPRVSDLPRIMKACIQQVMEQRPKEETFTDWMSKRTASLMNVKLRPQTRVMPFSDESDDIESQASPPSTRSKTFSAYHTSGYPRSSASSQDFLV